MELPRELWYKITVDAVVMLFTKVIIAKRRSHVIGIAVLMEDQEALYCKIIVAVNVIMAFRVSVAITPISVRTPAAATEPHLDLCTTVIARIVIVTPVGEVTIVTRRNLAQAAAVAMESWKGTRLMKIALVRVPMDTMESIARMRCHVDCLAVAMVIPLAD